MSTILAGLVPNMHNLKGHSTFFYEFHINGKKLVKIIKANVLCYMDDHYLIIRQYTLFLLYLSGRNTPYRSVIIHEQILKL